MVVHRFKLATHKKLVDLPIDLKNLTKDIFCSFKDFKAKAPHPYGLRFTALYEAEKKKRFYSYRKESFLESVKSCWVRTFQETDEGYFIIFW